MDDLMTDCPQCGSTIEMDSPCPNCDYEPEGEDVD